MSDTLYLEGARPRRTGRRGPGSTDANETSLRLLGDLASVCGVVNATAARMVAVISEVLAAESWTGPGIRSAAHWVGWQCGTTPFHAADLVQMARRLPGMPVTRGLFEGGQLSEDHVKIICRRVPDRFEADVAEVALALTSTQLSHLVNVYPFQEDPDETKDDDNPDKPEKRRVSFGSVSDKLWRLHAQLHPEEGAMLEKALLAARDAIFAECDEAAGGDKEQAAKLRSQVTWADAMVRLGDSYLGGATQAQSTRERYRVLMHLNAQRRFDPEPDTGPPPGPHPGPGTDQTDPPATDGDPEPDTGPRPGPNPGPGTGQTDPRATDRDPDPKPPTGRPAGGPAGGPAPFTLPGLEPDAETVEPHAHFHLGTALPDSLRRMITCDADLTPVFTYDGVINYVGVAQHTVPPRTRWAIEERDKGCRVPGCGHTRWLQIHHVCARSKRLRRLAPQTPKRDRRPQGTSSAPSRAVPSAPSGRLCSTLGTGGSSARPAHHPQCAVTPMTPPGISTSPSAPTTAPTTNPPTGAGSPSTPDPPTQPPTRPNQTTRLN